MVDTPLFVPDLKQRFNDMPAHYSQQSFPGIWSSYDWLIEETAYRSEKLLVTSKKVVYRKIDASISLTTKRERFPGLAYFMSLDSLFSANLDKE